MPDPYQNPDRKPPVNNYKWEPVGPPTGNSTTFGFNSLTLVRGKFLNELPTTAYAVIDNTTTPNRGYTITVNSESEIETDDLLLSYPFLATFRPFNRPSISLPYLPNANEATIVKSKNFGA